MKIREIDTLSDKCWTCEKTGKLCVPFNLGAPYYLKLTPQSDKPSAPPFAIWHHVRGCVGAETTWNAAVKRVNELHQEDVRRWVEVDGTDAKTPETQDA